MSGKGKVATVLLSAFGVAMLAAFGWGVGLAIRYTVLAVPPTPDKMSAFYTWIVSSTNALLAANLGAMWGVASLNTVQLLGEGRVVTWERAIEPIKWFQWFAAMVYVGAVLVTGFYWSRVDWVEDTSRVVPLIPEIVRSGAGILLALLAGILGVQSVAHLARANANISRRISAIAMDEGVCRVMNVGDRVVVMGTVPLESSGALHAPNDAYKQTLRCLEVVDHALAQVGSTLGRAKVARAFVTSTSQNKDVERAFREVFPKGIPALTIQEVKRLPLPDMVVEVEVEALTGT